MDSDQLLARELEQALELCRAAGWHVDVEYTSPPRGEPDGKPRVLRCRHIDQHRLLLTVAREVPGNQV